MKPVVDAWLVACLLLRVLPTDYENALLNDSKKLTEKQRYALRTQIEADALAWAVGEVTADEIDEINIT